MWVPGSVHTNRNQHHALTLATNHMNADCNNKHILYTLNALHSKVPQSRIATCTATTPCAHRTVRRLHNATGAGHTPCVRYCFGQQLAQLRVEGSGHVTRGHTEAGEQGPQEHGPGAVRLRHEQEKEGHYKRGNGKVGGWERGRRGGTGRVRGEIGGGG